MLGIYSLSPSLLVHFISVSTIINSWLVIYLGVVHKEDNHAPVGSNYSSGGPQRFLRFIQSSGTCSRMLWLVT